MSQLVRITYPLRLVRARLGAGGERVVLVAIGVVAGAAVLAAVLAGRLVMQDRALALATAQLSPGDREVQIVWSGAVDRFSQLDATVSPTVRSVTGQQPAAAMLFREASIQGRLVNLRAANDLGRFVHLISGRLPTTCVPSHCEVLRLKGKGPGPVDERTAPDRGRPGRVEAGRRDRPVRLAHAAHRTGRASDPVSHTAALSRRDRKRSRRAFRDDRAADVLPVICLVPAARPRRPAPLGRQRIHRKGAQADGRDRVELRRVPGRRADRSARDRHSVVAHRLSPPLLLSRTNHFPNGLANTNGHLDQRIMFHIGTRMFSIFDDRHINIYMGPNARSRHRSTISTPTTSTTRTWGSSVARRSRPVREGGRIAAAMTMNPPPGVPRWGAAYSDSWSNITPAIRQRRRRPRTCLTRIEVIDLDPDVKDAYGLPAPRMTYDCRRSNQVALVEFMAKKRKIGRAMEATNLWRGNPVPGSPMSHHQGGARMGSDPSNSVVNRYGQSWEIPNLFIIGSSTFPTSAGFNPTLTIQALAYMTADAIASRYRKNPGSLL